MEAAVEKTGMNRIQVVQYIAAVLVICVHCGPILEDPLFNYVIKNIFCRVAVPFFAVSTAFFVREKSRTQPEYFSSYLYSLAKNYLIWSLVFLPLGVQWIQQNMTLPIYLYPMALLVGLFYVGTFYHLWYMPALIFSLWLVRRLVRRYSYRVLLMGFGVLYLFGCLETYHGLLDNGLFIRTLIDYYLQFFVTTRNGLLFLCIFVTLGFLISDFRTKLTKEQHLWGLTISTIGLLAEGLLLFKTDYLDMNFLVMLLPVSFYLFLWALKGSFAAPVTRWKSLGNQYYFIHPYAIAIIDRVLPQTGMLQFILVILVTHGLSLLVLSFLSLTSSGKFSTNSLKRWLIKYMMIKKEKGTFTKWKT
ncbi:acyltransferase family protein [Enterococcus pallens]|uniref:Acyltransferase 3 domain-containing protein n=1 Tax=Enterococcus pallens ATCC BAA-351 TaxID=1158607 RepID=R2QG47_9ENTE|nr:acyltransferase [Enterococcus pallens]EOH94218.1 hypothetical protein UAU_01953 [Enterococcus pallens ATCC BAA-351]EOU24097.1 hypothetical protein I588_00084 [Enterococcus pallens ATCC BAA-351]